MGGDDEDDEERWIGQVVAAAKAERQTKRGTGQARVGRFQGPTHA